jgi:hypothetical protein
VLSIRSAFTIGAAGVFLGLGWAQNGPPAGSAPAAGPAVAAVPGQFKTTVQLGEPVTVMVNQYLRWLTSQKSGLDHVRLFLAGQEVVGLHSTSFAEDGELARLIFILDDEHLPPLVKIMMRKGDPIPVSVGIENSKRHLASTMTLQLNDSPRVLAVSAESNAPVTVRLERPIAVTVTGLPLWLAEQKKLDPDRGDEGHVRLFLAGHELIGVRPTVAALPDGATRLTFDMRDRIAAPEREEERRGSWASVIALVSRQNQVPVSIGIEKSVRLLPGTAVLKLNLYSNFTWLALALVPALFVAMISLGRKSDLVREIQLDDLPPGKYGCYSLARCQMAVWFFLVITAYIYITFTTGLPPSITPTILTLIGISASTGLAAAVIDNSQRNERVARHRDLSTRIRSLRNQIVELQKLPDTAAQVKEKTGQLADLRAQLATIPPPPPVRCSQGFLLDLLRDQDSVSFHRFQIVVWTVVLGVVFSWSVLRDLAMPEFDTTLLGLMGISSGTYLGFKFPDKPLPSPAPPQPAEG